MRGLSEQCTAAIGTATPLRQAMLNQVEVKAAKRASILIAPGRAAAGAGLCKDTEPASDLSEFAAIPEFRIAR